jgi:UDP-N-acetylmuramoyl-tripeptide--D-alanyl-D-alanine ligase
VLNADDACIDIWREQAAGRQIVTFGFEQPAVVRGNCRLHGFVCELEIVTPGGSVTTQLQLMGMHNARNALAAAAAAWAAGVPLAAIAAGLASVTPVAGRLQKKASPGGAVVIDDSYNANPDSVRAAIDVLAGFPSPRVLVLGDMGEVGNQGPEFHREIGAYARDSGIKVLLGFGELARESVAAFGADGRHAANLEELLSLVSSFDNPDTTILVKGSRFMKMERVVAALTRVGNTGGAH